MAGPLQVVLTVICGLCGALAWGLGLSGFTLFASLFAYAGVLAGSPFAIRACWRSIQDRELDVNFLMLLAAVGSVFLGHPTEGATLLFLFSLSSVLERYALGRTESAIEGLIKLRPDSALLITESGDVMTPVKDLMAGQEVRVVPFDQFPVDGEIQVGETSVNQAAMTGESTPVTKAPGDKVWAGTQNLEGTITVRVTNAVGETTLEKIVRLVAEAQGNKASGERISEWFGTRYTIFVFVVFLVSFGVRFAMGSDFRDAMYHAFTLLVALSPCALVISSPATTLSALAWAANHGMLIRGGHFIEEAGRVSTIAFDKTGTLTQGQFELREICVCHTAEVGVSRSEDHCWHGGPMSPDALITLRAVAAAEQYSNHPIAEAIVTAARNQGVDVPEAFDQKVVPGRGVTALVDGVPVKVGQLNFFEAGELPPGFLEHVEELQAMGLTTAVAQTGDQYTALAMGDMVRPEASSALKELVGVGIKKFLVLTGDSKATTQAVASSLGLTEFHAGLLPADKEKIIGGYSDVMMVGDGVNDAPSLARANIGVAMGGLGSDIALNSADVVLMQDRLSSLVDLIRLGRSTNRIIRTNLTFAAGMIVFLVVGSFVAERFAPRLSNAILPFAVFGHEGSTVLVILNGLRLLRGPMR